MKKAWISAIAIALVCAIVIGFLSRQPEPSYDGKSYSDWFRQFYMSVYNGRDDPAEREEALFAFHKMGTNVYPLLVKEYFSSENETLGKTIYKLRRLVFRHKKDFPPYAHPRHIRHQAAMAIQALGPSADTLLPRLEEALKPESKNHRSAIFLLGCVGEHGEQAVPWLRKALQHLDPVSRRMAIQSLSSLGAAADAALPELSQLFQNSNKPDPQVIVLLGSIGPAAKEATPKLETICGGNDWRGAYAAVALYQIEPGNRTALNVLTNLETAGSNYLQNMAWALSEARKIPIQFILPLTTNSDQMVRHRAISALVKHSPQAATNILKSLLESENGHTRFWAASQLMHIDGSQLDAQRFFIKNLYKEHWGEQAFTRIGESSPDAQEVISFLNFIVKSDIDEKMKRAAEKTLKRIKLRELMRKEGWKDNSPQ